MQELKLFQDEEIFVVQVVLSLHKGLFFAANFVIYMM